MDYIGDVTLPDGRIVHGKVCTTMTEWDTGGSDILSVDLEWSDGTPLTDSEMHIMFDSHTYLHEWVTDKLLQMTPEYPDLDP